jgi:hypothetical protein
VHTVLLNAKITLLEAIGLLYMKRSPSEERGEVMDSKGPCSSNSVVLKFATTCTWRAY